MILPPFSEYGFYFYLNFNENTWNLFHRQVGQILCIFSTYCPPFYTFFYFIFKNGFIYSFCIIRKDGTKCIYNPYTTMNRRRAVSPPLGLRPLVLAP